MVRGFELRSDLEQAIAKQQFLLHYQPVSELLTGRLVGFEALVRWMHPQRGLLAPQEFIPLAEATGLVVPMGRWVLAEACRAAVRLQARLGVPGLFMSVNLSPVQLSGSGLSTDVSDALANSGLAATELLLEVTETALADRTAAARALGDLRSLGVQLAIDDFGTGYSSLGHLAKLPVDIVKMDGSFVRALHEGDRAQALAAGIIGLSHNLGLRVIAEGIEERDQLSRLRELGCELGQGNLLAPPAPEADIVAAGRQDAAAAPARQHRPTARRPLPESQWTRKAQATMAAHSTLAAMSTSRKTGFWVLWRNTARPAQAPMTPPTRASACRNSSGTRQPPRRACRLSQP